MAGRWFFLAVVAIALVAIVKAPHSQAQATITQSCATLTPGIAQVEFAWPAPPAGTQQTWLDISLAPGFVDAVTKSNGPFAATQTAFTVAALPLGVKVYYRVNALASGGWHIVASGAFTTRCDPPATPAPAVPAPDV